MTKSNRRIAIVGTSHNMTDNEERDIRQFIAIILKNRCDKDTDIIISGGAKGVDTIAIEIAKGLGFQTKIYKSKTEYWKSYKERNLQIAQDCNELHCLSIPVHEKKCYHHEELEEHEKTAGCWTMNKAMELDKNCQLVVTLPR